MPNAPKEFIHGKPYFVSSRTEEGLPFTDTEHYRPLFRSIVARGLEKYPVKLIQALLMPNHLHLMFCPIDPEDVPRFMQYVKQELSHAINRRRGRRKKTNWCEGYDSPQVLDYKRVINQMVYIFTNPQSALLCERIDEYKNASTWEMFLKDETKVRCKHRLRSCYHMAESEYQTKRSHTFKLDPFCWLKKLAPWKTVKAVKQEIIRRVREREAELAAKRKLENKSIIKDPPSPELIEHYIPEKYGRRSICLSSEKELNVQFIVSNRWRVSLYREASHALRTRKKLRPLFPPGFFPPAAPPSSNRLC